MANRITLRTFCDPAGSNRIGLIAEIPYLEPSRSSCRPRRQRRRSGTTGCAWRRRSCSRSPGAGVVSQPEVWIANDA
jgi:hypothetical protein